MYLTCLKDGASPEKQEQSAGSSKPKSKVKSVELPILSCTVRQLDREILNRFVEEEVSLIQLSLIHLSKTQHWNHSLVCIVGYCLELVNNTYY